MPADADAAAVSVSARAYYLSIPQSSQVCGPQVCELWGNLFIFVAKPECYV